MEGLMWMLVKNVKFMYGHGYIFIYFIHIKSSNQSKLTDTMFVHA